MRCLRLRKLALTSTAEIAQSMLKQRKNRSPAPIFFPLLHHRRQVFPLPLQNCRIPENKRKKGYPPPSFRCVQALTSLSMLGREFAIRKLTTLTGGQWFHAVSSFSQGKTRSKPMYMDVHLVAMASLAVLNAYLRVHGSTTSFSNEKLAAAWNQRHPCRF